MEYDTIVFKKKPDSKAAYTQTVSGRIHKKLGPAVVSGEANWKASGQGCKRDLYLMVTLFVLSDFFFPMCVYHQLKK